MNASADSLSLKMGLHVSFKPDDTGGPVEIRQRSISPVSFKCPRTVNERRPYRAVHRLVPQRRRQMLGSRHVNVCEASNIVSAARETICEGGA